MKVTVDMCLHTGYNMAVWSAWQVYTVLVEPSRESWHCYPRCMTVDNAAIADDCEQAAERKGKCSQTARKKREIDG